MVPRANHIRLSPGDGSELLIELLGYGSVRVDAVEEVLDAQNPVICVAEIAGVDDEIVVVGGAGEAADGGVVEGRVDVGDRVPLRIVRFDGVSVRPVHAEVDDGGEGEGLCGAGRSRAEELGDARVRRCDLVVVCRAWT